MRKTIIREGLPEDLEAVHSLIKELAAFEKAPNEVETTVESMKIDAFGENPVFYFIVAEQEGTIVGTAIYYYRYSTWKGRRIYLEDFVVKEEYRGRGIGKSLFEEMLKITVEKECSGMVWQVLDWNEQAINFYKKYNSRFDGEWLNVYLLNEDINL